MFDRALMDEFGSVAESNAPSRAWDAGASYVHSPCGIAFLDRYGIIFKANLAWTRILGYTEGELTGQHLLDITDDADAEQSAVAYRDAWSATDEPVVIVKRYRHKDGRTIWGRVHIATTRDEGGLRGFIVFLEDWTDRRREGDRLDERKTEEALRASEARFKGTFESSGIGAVVMSIDGRWIRVNDALGRILDATKDRLIGCSMYDFAFPEDRALLPSAAGMIAEDRDVESFTTRLRHPAGHPIWVILHLSIVRKADSSPDYVLAQFQDISAQRLAEARLQEARIEAESMARVAATMNHEVRGPLNSIVGFTEMMESGMAGPLTEKQSRYLNNVLKASRSMLELITESIDISKIAAGRMQLDIASIDLRAALESALDQVAPLAVAKGSGLVLVCPRGLVALGDARRLNQILANLLANAVKHTPGGTTITLRGVAHGGRVEISVTDTGPGIRAEDLAILFQEFVQVGDDRSGSGLGLALSRKLALLMNGNLAATSRIGRGTIFTIDMPRLSPAGMVARS